MDAVFRRYMDILYKYVLEVSPPARKPLFLPSDPPPALEPSAEEEDNANDAGEQPPKKKQKRDKKEKTTSPNLLAMQPHLFHLLRPLVSKHHHIRDALARCKAGDIAAFEAVLQMVEAVTRDALVEYEATDGKSIEVDFQDPPAPPAAIEKDGPNEVALDESSVQTVKECKRPWWICQPYVRPLPAEALKKGALHLSKKELAKMVEEEEQKRAEGSKSSGASKPLATEAAPLASTSTVDILGHTELEAVNGGGGPETVEVPKEGLVCG
jgi:tRNA-dihydrouridine synthase 1